MLSRHHLFAQQESYQAVLDGPKRNEGIRIRTKHPQLNTQKAWANYQALFNPKFTQLENVHSKGGS